MTNVMNSVRSYMAVMCIALMFLSYIPHPVSAYGKTGTAAKGEWFSDSITKLSNMDMAAGKKDTLNPYDEIEVDEMIVMVVNALGYKLKKNGQYWAGNHIIKAREIGLVRDRDFDKYTRPMIRAEMARIVARSLEKSSSSIDAFRKRIKDFDGIPLSFREHVLKVYSSGIFKGYPDGEFKWDRPATKAEAAAAICNMIRVTGGE